MRGLNLAQLETFAHVVELGSFSAAAERLGISQPAVSLQVRQLEKRFGVRLVERVGRNARPTAAGEELLVHARTIGIAMEAATEAMVPHAAGVAGRVRIATGATACIYLLPSILRQLRERLPALEIVVSTGNTAEALKGIEESRIDVGLVTLPVPERSFDVRPVRDDELVAIASPEARLPREATPAALARLPLVVYEPGANTRRIIDAWFARGGVPLEPIMELGSVEAIKELVAAGLGCSVLPRMAVREAARFVVRPLRPRLSRKLALVLRRDKVLTKGLRELMRAIAAR